MFHYLEDIEKKIPLTKDIIWQQVKRDYGFTDAVEGQKIANDPKLREDIQYLVKVMIGNRNSNDPLGARFVTEHYYRVQIKKLLEVGYFEDYADSLPAS